ncbi:MAG: hypothetical protein MZW92_32985 [Comamonadaceae bacterium]|nr:hypothetical protein [Comamonadaceae bacterium]
MQMIERIAAEVEGEDAAGASTIQVVRRRPARRLARHDRRRGQRRAADRHRGRGELRRLGAVDLGGRGAVRLARRRAPAARR